MDNFLLARCIEECCLIYTLYSLGYQDNWFLDVLDPLVYSPIGSKRGNTNYNPYADMDEPNLNIIKSNQEEENPDGQKSTQNNYLLDFLF